MDDAGSDDDRRGRRRRLAIIGVVAAVSLGSGAVLMTIGSRRVSAEVDHVRTAAATANVDPADYLFAATNPAPDPVAAALGTDGEVSGYQQSDRNWCLTVTIARLLSRRSLYFTLGPDGAFTEVGACPGS